MKIGAFLLRAGIVLALLVLVAALTAHWASRSEAVLRWAATQLAERLPGTLTLTGLHGALDRPIRIDAIDYRIGTTHVRAQQVDVEWSLAALLSMRQLVIGKLSVVRLEVSTRPGNERAQPPEHLRPPMPVRIDVLEVHTLRVDNGTTPVELSDIAMSYAADMDRHALELKRLASPWGTGHARLELGTQAPFALAGSAQWDAVVDPVWPLAASLNIGGDLSRIDAHGSIRLRGVELPTQAVIAPFEAVQLVQLTASVDALDMAAWFPALPRTSIHAQLQAAGAATGAPIQGTLEASNAQAGALDSKRLPLARLTADIAVEDDGIHLHRLAADLAGAGSAQGALALKRSGLDARLQVRGLDLHGVHGALHHTNLNGGIVIDRAGERAHVTVDLTQRGMHLTGRARHEGEQVVIEDALLQAGAGRMQLQGRLALSGAQPFAASARLVRVNPADFGAFPQARVSGTLAVEGGLQPQWQARAEYLLQDSQWRGYRLAGSGRLALSAQRAHDVDARINLGRNVLQVQGAFGANDDRL
ncbi:MAG: hypothetical protein KIS79_17305, partial [Burkholderiales bacterium]|nr:hypothetical protein [Burkholderiales bacterium]